jgi:hypothetical protein
MSPLQSLLDEDIRRRSIDRDRGQYYEKIVEKLLRPLCAILLRDADES